MGLGRDVERGEEINLTKLSGEEMSVGGNRGALKYEQGKKLDRPRDG